eukprot:m.285059 g.285059  ORF g.285059 m.285059 type:complete len:755 (+) comp16200_c1_seq15:3773-6037(+)
MFATIVGTTLAAAASATRPAWVHMPGTSCGYIYILETASWETAARQCSDLRKGSRLAAIDSLEESSFVRSRVAPKGTPAWVFGFHEDDEWNIRFEDEGLWAKDFPRPVSAGAPNACVFQNEEGLMENTECNLELGAVCKWCPTSMHGHPSYLLTHFVKEAVEVRHRDRRQVSTTSTTTTTPQPAGGPGGAAAGGTGTAGGAGGSTTTTTTTAEPAGGPGGAAAGGSTTTTTTTTAEPAGGPGAAGGAGGSTTTTTTTTAEPAGGPGGAGGAGGSTTTTTTTTTQVLTPSNFCSMFMSTCGNGFGWNDANACQTSVTRYIDGTPGATSGNTLACRIYHLNVARQQIDGSPTESLHCSHASDSGNNTCVGAPSASDFCDDFIDTCGVNNGWVSAGECQAAVPAFITGSYPTDTTGNTLSCRAYHLGVAKSQAPATTGRANHCAHASSNGTDSNGGMPCAGSQVSVTNFCNDFISTCGGGNGWSDSAACVGEASTFVRGTLGDTTSFNTLECRIYHLTVAKRQSNSTLRATHCIHASRPGVTNVCDPIPSAADFCVTYLDVCTVSGSWSTQQGCVNGFSTVPRGFQGDTSGNSQGCRIYHLGAAMTNVAPGTAAHCSHASETGNNVCVDAPGSPVAPPVALTTTAAPTSPAPTVVGATLAPTAAPVVSGSSGNTAASAAGATSERSQHSKSSSTVAYVLTFLIGLLAYEYVLYLNAVQELVTPTSSITPKIALNDLSGTGTRSPTVTTPPLVFMQNA